MVGGFTLSFLVVRSLGWKALLGSKASFKESFFKTTEGYFINNIFPFRLGEISRALFMGNTLGVSPVQILSTIIVERVFDLIILAILILNMLPFALGLAINATYIWAMLGTLVVGLILLYIIVRNSAYTENFLNTIGEKIPFLNRFIIPILKSFLNGFQILTDPSQFVLGFIGIAGSWLVSLIQYSLFLFLLFPNADWWWGAFSNVATAFGLALPSAPGGLGIFEATIIAALSLFEVPETIGLAYALVLHVVHYIITALIGIYALYRDGVSLKGLFTKLMGQKNLTQNMTNKNKIS